MHYVRTLFEEFVNSYDMKYSGFLCGAFSTKGSIVADECWKSVVVDESMCLKSSNYYYPEFVQFCYGANKNSIHRFVMDVKQTIKVSVDYGTEMRDVEIFVSDVTIYQAPFDLTLFAVRVDMSGSANDITAVVSRLRTMDGVAQSSADFSSVVLDPLMDIYRRYAILASEIEGQENAEAYCRLVEYGNKLKTFQIAVVESEPWEEESSDSLLFEMGTLSPIGSYNPDGDYSASKSYVDQIFKDGKVSVFNNWKALSLFDTFTILGHHISEGNIANWIDNYFGMVYISELFVKFYLFRLNNDFRIDNQRADWLLEQFEDFEYSCWFDNVSYNFLPRIIHRSMEQGLEVLSEKQRLYQMIAQQKDSREKRSSQRINNLLFYLTSFTIISMVYDAASLFNEMYPFETYLGSHIFGFRMVSYTLLVLMLLLLVVVRFKKR